MSEEKNESRINIEDLPQAEQELSDEEAKDVKGGSGSAVWAGTVRLDTNTTH